MVSTAAPRCHSGHVPGPLDQNLPTASDEDELVIGTHRPWPRRAVLLVLAGLVLVALTVAGITAATRTSHRHVASSPTAPATTTRAAATRATTPRPAPAPSVPALPAVASCPAGASCSLVSDLPLTTATELREALPDVVVTRSVSLVANRVGHFEPDLVARRVEALAFGGRVNLLIEPAPSRSLPLAAEVVRAAPTTRGATVVGRLDGYVVSGSLTGPSLTITASAAIRILRELVVSAPLLDAQ